MRRHSNAKRLMETILQRSNVRARHTARLKVRTDRQVLRQRNVGNRCGISILVSSDGEVGRVPHALCPTIKVDPQCNTRALWERELFQNVGVNVAARKGVKRGDVMILQKR